MRKHFQTLPCLCALVFVLGCGEKPAEKPPLAPSQLRGQRLYQASCEVCHRTDSEASLNGPGLKAMYKKKYLTSGAPANDERVEEVIRRGRRSMPGYDKMYSDQQMADLIAYLHTL